MCFVKKLLTVGYLLITVSIVCAQESATASRDSVVAIIKALLDSKNDGKITTGTFKAKIGEDVPVSCFRCTTDPNPKKKGIFKIFRKKNITTCDYEDIGTTTLDSIEISIIDGTAREINVWTALGKFTNKRSPISIPYFENRLHDRLGHIENDGIQVQEEAALTSNSCSQRYVKIKDVLGYSPRTGKNYIPDDNLFTLNSKLKSKTLTLNPELNVLINVKLYSDLLAVLDKQANGITQTDLSTRIIVNTKNVRNRGVIPFNYIRVLGSFSKFDGKYKALAADTSKEISRQNLMQRSWGNVGVEMNLFKTWISKKTANYFGVDAGLSGYWSKVTEGKDKDTTNSFLPTYFVKPFVSLNPLDNFGFEASIYFMRQRLSSNEWITNYHSSTFIRPEFSIYYNTFGNPNSRVYVRFSNTYCHDERRKSFQQLQFGYTITLNQAIKSK